MDLLTVKAGQKSAAIDELFIEACEGNSIRPIAAQPRSAMNVAPGCNVQAGIVTIDTGSRPAHCDVDVLLCGLRRNADGRFVVKSEEEVAANRRFWAMARPQAIGEARP